MTESICGYKENILLQINKRNQTYEKFAKLILACSMLEDEKAKLEKENSKLNREVGSLKAENQLISTRASTSVASSDQAEQNSILEKKLIRTQEELVECQRTIGTRILTIADLNIALRKMNDENKHLEDKFNANKGNSEELSNKCSVLQQELESVRQAKQTIQDEYQALLLASSLTDEKLRKLKDEHRDLLDRYLRYKNSDANQLNSANDVHKRVRDEKTSAELLEAMTEASDANTTAAATQANSTVRQQSSNESAAATATSTPPPPVAASQTRSDGLGFLRSKFQNFLTSVTKPEEDPHAQAAAEAARNQHSIGVLQVTVPKTMACRWKAHISEVTATRFSSTGGNMLATGGNDKLINVWNFVGDQARLQSTLRGSNAGITSIDMDPNEQLLSSSSNDCAIRIWLMSTQRLRLTLTGHLGKVLSARFLGSTHRLASGGNDRTVKIWDIRTGACQRTLMCHSSCNDVICADGGNCVISAHFDKKIRVWDTRSGKDSVMISVGGRVTSLDMPADDMTSLVSCTKDHTLEVVDLRKSQVRSVYRTDDFKVATDQTRCAYSPDAKYVAVGSTDGTLFCWDVHTDELICQERIHTDPIITCNWKSGRLVSSDKNKMCVIWGA